MSSWLYWGRWVEMYHQWERWSKASGKPITLTFPALRGVFDWFTRELQLRPEVDVQLLDVEHTLSYDLTVGDAKEALKKLMITMPSEADYERAAQQAEADIEREIREKYPEFLPQFQERVEREVKRGVRKGAEHYKKVIEELRIELVETKKRMEQERKARAEKVKPAKLKVLKDFTEGILTYRAGTEIESADLEWIMVKAAEGKIERVGAPAPPVTAPPTPPLKEEVLPIPPRYLTVDEVNRLWEEFGHYARFKYPESAIAIEPKTYRLRFLERMKDARDYNEAARRSIALVDAIIQETRPAVAPPTVERRVVPMEERERMAYELGTNRWWHERLERERSREHPTLEQFLLSKYKKRSLAELPQAEWERILREYDDFLMRE